MITATATLTMLDKAYKALPEDQKNIADVILSGKWYKENPIAGAEPGFNDLGTTFDKSIGALIGEMIRAFKADITVSESKKSKSGVNRSVIVKLIKAAAKANIKECYKYTLIENGKQTYCDGIFAFAFAETDNTLPILPENLISTALKPEEKLFVGLREQKSAELELPSLKLLENYAKNNSKKYNKALFSFGYDLPVVRADYLATAMKAVPGAKFYMTKTVLMPIYGIDEDGNEVAVCPIRTKEPMPRTEV